MVLLNIWMFEWVKIVVVLVFCIPSMRRCGNALDSMLIPLSAKYGPIVDELSDGLIVRACGRSVLGYLILHHLVCVLFV